MGNAVKSIFGMGDKADTGAQQGAALASLLARDQEASKELAATGGRRGRRTGRSMLTYLQEDGTGSLN
ncbi:hypothetical protein [Ancylobacter sp. SL191]|uniref:hypothetical protein n=1 Tax=Ancylobacter sp. SL191 TaxID=2995166 RepID=UPI0022700248|nr:hypothetical protein [Ancylobacter sp. SL191]WAC26333.1 hypothetical protein OU996_15105 [Ancylobacter sp. SL191]